MKVLYHHVRPDNAAVRFIEMRAHFTRPQAWNFGGYSIALGPELILSITITWNIPPPFFFRLVDQKGTKLFLFSRSYCYYPADYCPKRFVLFHAGCSLKKRNE